MKFAYHQGFFVGLFSSYAKQLEQGWRLFQELSFSSRAVELQQTPRFFARITDEKLRLMIADYEAGISAYELTDRYGHNRGTIMKHLAGAGVSPRVAVPTNHEIFRWQELHAEGLGYKTVARRVGRNHKTIRKYLASKCVCGRLYRLSPSYKSLRYIRRHSLGISRPDHSNIDEHTWALKKRHYFPSV